MWIAVILALALALGASKLDPQAPPLPDAPPRCDEIRITSVWLSEHRGLILRAVDGFNEFPDELAVPAMLGAMKIMLPECDWTPSTTTEIVGADGVRRRFDAVIRTLQDVLVRDAAAALKLPGAEGESPVPLSAVEIVIGGRPLILEPPHPEGTGAPTPSPKDPLQPWKKACDRTRIDGDAMVCLRRKPTGQWMWTWTPLEGAPLEGVAASAGDATILAYQAAASHPVGYVTVDPVSRAGVKLERDGELVTVDAVTWGQAVHKRLRDQWIAGERDPMGIVLAAFQNVFPGVNWFRIKPLGGLAGASARVQNVVLQSPNAPDIADQLARAIIGASLDKTRHVFRGHIIETKASAQGWYQYRVDGGPWIGAYQTIDQALAAAHGA